MNTESVEQTRTHDKIHSNTLDLDHRAILEVLEKAAKKHDDSLEQTGNDNLLLQRKKLYTSGYAGR